MGRAPCCDKANVKKGPWSSEEDAKLKEFIEKNGTGGNWIALPHKAGLKRCGKSCRLRWLNYLRPNIKHGEFSEDEDRIICSLYANIGSRWSIIAGQLPGRTDNDIKNYWNTKLRKKLLAMLPSFQKKPSFFPSIPPPLSDHHKSESFLNPSSSFYNNLYNPNNFMNVNTNMNSLLTTNTTTPTTNLVHNQTNVNDLFKPPLPSNPNLVGMISNHNYNLGFQDHNMNKEYYYPEMKERMLMFGGGATCSSSEGGGGGGGCIMSQLSYNKSQQQIKKEDYFALEGFGDQNHCFTTDQNNYVDQKTKGYFKNLEEMNQLIDIKNRSSSSSINVNINSSSYMMNDHDHDENKTTHIYYY